ncbi:MAG: DUF5615 family PIN-like protein [Candidatus Ranarchaeia archaeon]
MKYLADKALSPRSVRFLQRNGFDAKRVDEVIGNARIEDREIFAYAIAHDYAIITADLDFGAIIAYTKSKKPSIIILRLEDQRVEHVNRILHDTLPIC